jgi:hypothetical protein
MYCYASELDLRDTFLSYFHKFGLHSTGLYKKARTQTDDLVEVSKMIEKILKKEDLFPNMDHEYNSDLYKTIAPLLLLFDNIKPFVYMPIYTGTYDLKTDLEFEPDALVNYNLELPGYQLFMEYLSKYERETCYSQLLLDFSIALDRINTQKLFGEHTGSYYAMIKYWTDIPYDQLTDAGEEKLTGIIQSVKKVIGQLYKRLLFCVDNPQKCQKLNRSLNDCVELYVKLLIYSYVSAYPESDWDYLSLLLSDEIADCIMVKIGEISSGFMDEDDFFSEIPVISKLSIILFSHKPKNGSICVEYVKHNLDYVFLGDKYGDCTANKRKKQVDTQIANIHWTVYSWIMHPYYRVMEVSVITPTGRKERLIKAHIIPLIIHEQRVLMIDAIESTIKLREKTRGEINPAFDSKLFAVFAEEAIDRLFDECRRIAHLINAEAIYVELFSNAQWINRRINLLPHDSYHIDDIIMPFDNQDIITSVKHLNGLYQGDIMFELQAINTQLMEHYMKSGYKEVGVLSGRRENWKIHLRGV